MRLLGDDKLVERGGGKGGGKGGGGGGGTVAVGEVAQVVRKGREVVVLVGEKEVGLVFFFLFIIFFLFEDLGILSSLPYPPPPQKTPPR